MTYARIINVFIILALIKDLRSQRRILGGEELKTNKPYLVYLVISEKSAKTYTGWTCGGVIVSPQYIVTAAACIEDVQYLYAIAGYKKFVSPPDIKQDKCTKEMKKKIVYTCVPKSYEFDYANVGKWSAIDIGVAKVESPYNFDDNRYQEICSYKPNKININYDPKYQEPGIDALVMGWGHLKQWRQPGDDTIYTQTEPRYASTQILNKKKCKDIYADFPDLQVTIDKYMICTNEFGNINAEGDQISTIKPTADGCSVLRYGKPRPECINDGKYIYDMTRRSSNFNITNNVNTRRQGICQNDHGGPLVTWIGGHEVLIGVASVFRVNANSQCEGPYLFTSTQCNGAFLYCVLNSENRRRNSICDQSPRTRGFDMVHRRISWINHPDGPAENEAVKIRPQIPIGVFG
ncbi:unnamed protein product [Parnassius mnemosyne]|uniref:Peptidase S1 domain-containing protein n=1 Tax=Parnassius mnemosyne TaxID=213953 RepID=A0AAV1LK96_9NEOP